MVETHQNYKKTAAKWPSIGKKWYLCGSTLIKRVKNKNILTHFYPVFRAYTVLQNLGRPIDFVFQSLIEFENFIYIYIYVYTYIYI